MTKITIATIEGGTDVVLDPVVNSQELADMEAERTASAISGLRGNVINRIITEAIRRIKARVPALCSFEMVDLMAILWPTLNTAAAGANLIACRDIYLYAKSKITRVDTATQVQLEAYDPGTDPDFPS